MGMTTHTDPAAIAKAHLAAKTTAELVELAELVTAQRDAATDGETFTDLARVLGFVWDALDERLPHVLEAWDAACVAGRDVDLTAMYRAEVAR